MASEPPDSASLRAGCSLEEMVEVVLGALGFPCFQAERRRCAQPVCWEAGHRGPGSLPDIPVRCAPIMATLRSRETRGAWRRLLTPDLIDDHLQAMGCGLHRGAHEHLQEFQREDRPGE